MLLTNARIATMSEPAGYGLIDDGAIVTRGDRIVWVGARADLPAEHAGEEVTDLGGRLVTPALIDCHTHLVFGGNRAGEFEQRLEGVSYEQIARSGGGIVSTVRATRDATPEALLHSALTRVDAMIAEGVSTIEVKSGYGLDREAELKMLRVARQIADVRPVTVRTTYLGCLLYTSPSPRDLSTSRMPSSA